MSIFRRGNSGYSGNSGYGNNRRGGNGFFNGRYGMDELGKALLIAGAIVYFIGILLQSSILMTLALMAVFFELYRMMSRQHWDRSEENRKYNQYVKLWKLRYKERRVSRIYMCKSCGRMIRVPKNKGKVQVTCPVCGWKSIHRT